MGIPHPHREPLNPAALRNRLPIRVIASAEYLEPLQAALADELPTTFRFEPVGAREPLAAWLFDDVSLAVIEVNPDDRDSIRRIGAVRQRHPGVALVAAINGASVSLVRMLVREGISDVVTLPFDLDDLLQVTLDVLARREADAPVLTALAPMIAVTRSIGGCGATSIATHLAADLAAHDGSDRGAVIVDLDLQFGSVSDFLGVRPSGSVADLLGDPSRLDIELIDSVSAQTAGGLTVIGAPEAIMPLESVSTDDLLRMLQLLRQRFGFVVLDLPANWTNWTLSAALAADSVVLVTELSVSSLRQAKRRLELFRSVGIEDDHVEIVVNRVEKRLFRTIGVEDVSTTLGHSVLGSVALDAPLVSTAQDQGELVGNLQRKSKFARDIAELGVQLRSRRLSRNR
jgi:pilus assembly protein CpaE